MTQTGLQLSIAFNLEFCSACGSGSPASPPTRLPVRPRRPDSAARGTAAQLELPSLRPLTVAGPGPAHSVTQPSSNSVTAARQYPLLSTDSRVTASGPGARPASGVTIPAAGGEAGSLPGCGRPASARQCQWGTSLPVNLNFKAAQFEQPAAQFELQVIAVTH